jgi:hypothetical protein
MASTFFLFNLASKSIARNLCQRKNSFTPTRNFHSIPKNRLKAFFKLNQNVHRQLSTKTRQLKNLKIRPLNFKKNLAGSFLIGSGVFVAVYDSEKLCSEEISKKNLSELIKSLLGFFVQFAECEEKLKENDFAVKKNRTALYEETIGNDNDAKKEPNFDWNEFFKLIYQEKYYFLAAVVVI